ncbi:MAG: restriction endonuclease subunit S [Thermoguttaceae bacterium]|nr:restriction endonuclease subunit S [Thermoguttaceae bacterium]
MTAQELKNSVLRRAFRGELVERRAEEGTGAELLRQIEAEKASLTKAGKLKKEKPLPPITEEEKPFEIPEHWTWVWLLEVVRSVGGKENQILAKEVKKTGAFPAVSQGQQLIDGYCDCPEKVVQDLPLVMFGDHTRNVKYIDFPFVISADGTKFMKAIVVNPKYLFFWLLWTAEQLRNRGYARHFSLLKQRPLPLPPLAEQARIVAKLEEIWPEIERYAAARDELEALNRRFPNDLRKAVLQSAIRGELVERRDEEGTGAELLKQIEAEKASLTKAGKLKKEKPLPPITDEEKPFDIPEHWTWTRLGEIGRLLSGQDMPPSLYNANRLGIPYITGASNIEDSQVIINRWTESPKAVATCGCLLLTCKGTVGKTAILKEQQVHIARQLMAITPILVGVRYIRFFIETQIDFLKSQAKSMIPGIERKNVLNLPIPLPPLAEQARIVAKLEEILPLCDRLR